MIRVKRNLNSTDVVDGLTDLFLLRGPPKSITLDNGAEFIAKKCGPRSGRSVPKQPSSRQDLHGRTATARASTLGFGTSC